MPLRIGPEVQALPRRTRLGRPRSESTAARFAEPIVPTKRGRRRAACRSAAAGAQQAKRRAIARSLVKGVRAHKAAGLDAFLHAYDLGTDEGIALMCLAEALLRIPDAETADELIADKLSGPDWAEKLGESASPFVNAATFSLLLTGKVLEGANDSSRQLARGARPRRRPARRAGDPHRGQPGDEDPRQAVRVRPDHRRGAEARRAGARAGPDATASTCSARRRRPSPTPRAMPRPTPARSTASREEAKGGFRLSPGISVKLSALHPRYEWSHAEEAKAAMLPILRELALKASKADVHFTIDAEEADRLELSMDMIEALARRRRAVRQRLGRVRAGAPGLSEARRAAVRLGGRAGPQAPAAS